MHYGELKNCDIANGTGVRVTLFVSGCTNHCPRLLPAPDVGFLTTAKSSPSETKAEISRRCWSQPYVNGLTLLGGEPFEPREPAGAAAPAAARYGRSAPG